MQLLNLDALKNLDSLVDRTEGPFYYMRQGDIKPTEPIVVRLLFPKPLHVSDTGTGFWFTYLLEHWFQLQGKDKKTKVLSTAPYYGAASDYVELAKTHFQTNMPQAAALFKVKDNYDKNTTFVFPCLVLENVKTGPDGSIISYSVKNDKVCLFQCTKGTIDSINTIVTSPFRQRPSGKSIADLDSGFSLSISKSEVGQGAKKKITYHVDCLPVPHAIDAKWEADLDLDKWHKGQLYSDTYIASVVTHFVTGRGIMDDPEYRHPELRESRDSSTPTLGGVTLPPMMGQPAAVQIPTPAPAEVAPVFTQPATPGYETPQAVPQVTAPAVEVPIVAAPVEAPAVVEMPTMAPMPDVAAVAFTNVGSMELPASVSNPGGLLAKLKANQA